MPCNWCSRWAYAWSWHCEYRGRAPDPASGGCFYRDLEHPGWYWYIVCQPSCGANATIARLQEIEESVHTELQEVEESVYEVFELQHTWLGVRAYEPIVVVGTHLGIPPASRTL